MEFDILWKEISKSEDYKKESARYIAETRAFVADIERAKDGLDKAIGRRVAFEKTKRYWKWAWLVIGVLITALLQYFWPSLF